MTWRELVRLIETKAAYVIAADAQAGWLRATFADRRVTVTVYKVPHDVVARLAGNVEQC